MLRERLMVAALAALITLLALAPIGYMARRHWPPTLATVDLQRLVEEQQQHLATLSGAGGQFTPEQRTAAQKKSMQYAKQLSAVIDELGTECGCVIVNKAALIGGQAVDYTDTVRSRIGRLP